MDVPLNEDVANVAREVLKRYEKAGGKVDHIKITHNLAEAAKVSRIKGAKVCYAWKASTLQPWEFTAHIMRENLENGLNLQIYTVAKSITKARSGLTSESFRRTAETSLATQS
jgi:hypothetical protein